MSKWRYEVTENNCSYFDRPDFAVFSRKSIEKNMARVFKEPDEAKDNADFWSEHAQEEPFKVEITSFSNFNSNMLNKPICLDISIEYCFPAKRIGRMFPRHKNQIIYVG